MEPFDLGERCMLDGMSPGIFDPPTPSRCGFPGCLLPTVSRVYRSTGRSVASSRVCSSMDSTGRHTRRNALSQNMVL
jgi:hypothetical protein